MDDDELDRLAGLQRFQRRSRPVVVAAGVLFVVALAVAGLLLAAAR